MDYHQIVVFCQDDAEAEKICGAIGDYSVPVFYRADDVLKYLAQNAGCFLALSPLAKDENATGILTRSAVDAPVYSVLCATSAQRVLNVVRLFGCGCAHILGPDELDLLRGCLEPSTEVLDAHVIPPFFIDDDESHLSDPSALTANPLHLTFLGSQALMSCSNALLNIAASDSMSMACVAPGNPWARDRFVRSLSEYTLWKVQTKPMVSSGCVTLCNDYGTLASLEPATQHFAICHGFLSSSERKYLSRLPENSRIFMATAQGYQECSKTGGIIVAQIPPIKLWDIFISALYN